MSAPAADGPAARAGRFWAEARVAAAPEEARPGSWAGAPSALRVDGAWWLAHRLRRPV